MSLRIKVSSFPFLSQASATTNNDGKGTTVSVQEALQKYLAEQPVPNMELTCSRCSHSQNYGPGLVREKRHLSLTTTEHLLISTGVWDWKDRSAPMNVNVSISDSISVPTLQGMLFKRKGRRKGNLRGEKQVEIRRAWRREKHNEKE